MDRVLSTSSFARKYGVYLVHSRLCSTLNTTWGVQSQLVRESCEVPCTVPVVQGHNTSVQCCTAAPNGQPSSAVKLCWGETVRLPCSLGEQYLWDAVPWCVCWRHAMSFMQIPCRKEPERSHALSDLRGFAVCNGILYKCIDCRTDIENYHLGKSLEKNEISADCNHFWINNIFW